MPRYVIAQPIGDGTPPSDERTVLTVLQDIAPPFGGFTTFTMMAPQTVEHVATDDAAASVVVDCPAPEMQRRRAELPPNTIVEEECPRWPALFRPAANLRGGPSLPAGVGAAIDVTLAADAPAVDGALVQLFLMSPRVSLLTSVSARTDRNGRTSLPYDASNWIPASLSVEPRAGAWPSVAQVTGRQMIVPLAPLPRSGPLGWWHRVAGVNAFDRKAGEGIRVGVIDTGVGPHPYVGHVKRAGAIANGQRLSEPSDSDDVAEHGTHVCGTIGGRPAEGAGHFGGVAPAAEIVVLRVYPGGGPPGSEAGVATNNDISMAITVLSRDEQCDIINISSGGLTRSALETDRVNAAVGRGTVVICASGNGGGLPVLFPAAEPTAVAVSALGFIGCQPGALEATILPAALERYAFGYYSPSFCSIGPELKCAGPGVGVIAPVPTDGDAGVSYAAMSGTSMAAPVVTGVLAALLSRDPAYRGLPRGRERTMYAWNVLARSLRSLGLPAWYQGFGVPVA